MSKFIFGAVNTLHYSFFVVVCFILPVVCLLFFFLLYFSHLSNISYTKRYYIRTSSTLGWFEGCKKENSDTPIRERRKKLKKSLKRKRCQLLKIMNQSPEKCSRLAYIRIEVIKINKKRVERTSLGLEKVNQVSTLSQ